MPLNDGGYPSKKEDGLVLPEEKEDSSSAGEGPACETGQGLLIEIILDAFLHAASASKAALLLRTPDGVTRTARHKGYASAKEISPVLEAAGKWAPQPDETDQRPLLFDLDPAGAHKGPRPAALLFVAQRKGVTALLHLERDAGGPAFEPSELETLAPHGKALGRTLESEMAASSISQPQEREFLTKSAFRLELQREIKRSSRYLKSCSLLSLLHEHPDVKAEEFPDGENALAEAVGQRYTTLIRDIDLIGRPDAGLRFDILLPDTDKEGATRVARRILRVAEDKTIQWRGGLTVFPVAIGVATYPEDALAADSLRARAGTALEQARRLGPNSVSVYGESAASTDRAKKPASKSMASGFFRVSPESMTALEMTDRLLQTGLEVDRLLETVIALGAMGTGANRGCLAMYDNEEQLGVKSYYQSDKLDDVNFAPPEHMFKRAIQTGKPVAETNRPNGDTALGGPSICAPIAKDGRIIGVLYFENPSGGEPFEKSHTNFLEIFTKKISGAIHRLYEREIERSQLRSAYSSDVRPYKYSYDNIIGRSKPMQRLYEILDKVVETDHSVIVEGESGTGKELVAHAIHFNGARREKPFIAENCAALSDNLLEAELFGYVKGAFTGADQDRKGFFEIATGGTLFLDEIGEMNTKMQKDLLRVLQEGEIRPVGGKKFIKVDVRIICASNRSLKELLKEGLFREDLYYRLNVVTINLPSLRERVNDIPLLVEHFLDLIAKETNQPKKKLTPRLMEALMRYEWPGNIRELKNEAKRMVAMSKEEELDLGDFQYTDRLPDFIPSSVGGSDEILTLEDLERRHILSVLEKTGGNKMKAAELLGINRATIFRKLRKYDLV